MSANNVILIRWLPKEKVYLVTHRDAESNSSLGMLGNFDSLEDAVRGANTFMEKEYVEYGLQIVPKDE